MRDRSKIPKNKSDGSAEKIKKPTPNLRNRSLIDDDSDFVSDDIPPSDKKEKKRVDYRLTENGLLSHCRPNGLNNVVRKFNDKQKSDIKEIGFGTLLELRVDKCVNVNLMAWLVQNFNSGSRMLTVDNYQSFCVTPDDVYDVFMLPRNEGMNVTVFTTREGSEFLNFIKDEYDIKVKMHSSCLVDVLLKKFEDGGLEFKRIFVLYAVSSFLAPSVNGSLKSRVAKSLEDVSMIPKLDWCKFVLDELCSAISKFKERSSTRIGGCILLLQIIYFHRMIWRGIPEPISIPLILHWTDNKLTSRKKEELQAGRFGMGKLSDRYPLSVNGVAKSVDLGTSSSVVMDDEQTKEVGSFLQSLKRDADTFLEKYQSKLVKLSKLGQKIKNNQSSTPEESDSQKFFSDEKVLKYIDDIVKHFKATKKLAAEMPSYKFTPSPPMLSDPKEDYFEAARQNFNFEDVELDEDHDVEDVSLEELSEARDSIQRRRPQRYLNLDNMVEDFGYVSKFMTQHKKVFERMQKEFKEILDYIFYDAEFLRDRDRYYRRGLFHFLGKNDILSMKRNCEIYDTIISAWIVEVNADSSHDGHKPRFVLNIDHSKLLQQTIESDDPEDNYNDFKGYWDLWLESFKDILLCAELIFVPMCLQNHYNLVVINLVDSKIQYLDNKKWSNSENQYYYESARFLAGVRLRLRAEISANIILSNFNELKDYIIIETKKFYKKKPDLIKNISEHKKENLL